MLPLSDATCRPDHFEMLPILRFCLRIRETMVALMVYLLVRGMEGLR